MAFKNPKDFKRAPAGGILGVWERFVMFMRGWLPAWEPSILITIEEGAGDAAERLTVERAIRRRYLPYLPELQIARQNGKVWRLTVALIFAVMILAGVATVIFDVMDCYPALYVSLAVNLAITFFSLAFVLATKPDIQKLNYRHSVDVEAYRFSGRILPHVYARPDIVMQRLELVASFDAVVALFDKAKRHDGDDSDRVRFLKLILSRVMPKREW